MRSSLRHPVLVQTFADGTAVKFTSVGGYPIFYVSRCNGVLCPQCALNIERRDAGAIVATDANWENPTMYCDDCQDRIESAYAESEAI